MNLENLITSETINNIISWSAPYITRIIISLIGFWIGWKLINFSKKIVNKAIIKKLDDNIESFVLNLYVTTLRVLLVVSLLSTLGVETTSVAALIGALGLAAGMAMSGTLQNFASAVIIFLFKPYTVGELIKVNDELGFVREIQIFSTVIQRIDKLHVFIPNQIMTSDTLVNYSRTPTRRKEISIGVGYGSDLKKVEKIITTTLSKLEFVLPEPEIRIGVSELGDSAIVFKAAFHVKSEDWGHTIFDTMQPVYDALEKAKIDIPYPTITIQK